MMGQNVFTAEALRSQRDCFFAHRETTMSKDPGPKDPALSCPQRGLLESFLDAGVCWSNGVME